MSFQAYLDTIKNKTGKTPAHFKKLAEKQNLLNENTRAGDLVKWLKNEFELGHGHAMAIWKFFQDNGWVSNKKATLKEEKSKTPAPKKKSDDGKRLVDKYIAGFPSEIQELLEKMRTTIAKAAPDAQQTIAYGIPTFKLNGNLVHFAGYKNHIGFYPAPSAITAFAKELSIYEGAKGSVQFPVDKRLPLSLVTTIVKFRVKENGLKAKK